ncbi:MAG: hypothetical protein ACLT08_01725 [Roseburia inulinivorans]
MWMLGQRYQTYLGEGSSQIPVTVSGLLDTTMALKDMVNWPLALDSTCIVATKELVSGTATPMIDCFDYSWSIVSDPQKGGADVKTV